MVTVARPGPIGASSFTPRNSPPAASARAFNVRPPNSTDASDGVMSFAFTPSTAVDLRSSISITARPSNADRVPPPRRYHDAPDLLQQRLRRNLPGAQHLPRRVALNPRFQHHPAVGVQSHVHRVGIAEQVVQIAQDLLIRAHQKRA